MSSTDTPMMRQYLEIKEDYKDCILFYRLGDFYEMFFEDAVIASKILNIALTSRNKGSTESVPLCGIPYHSADSYIAKLLELNKKVAICEQMEDPKFTKGIVKREVLRVFTPGVNLLELNNNKFNLLVSIYIDGNKIGFARCDSSTGLFEATELKNRDHFFDEVSKLKPKEIIFAENQINEIDLKNCNAVYTKLKISSFDQNLITNLNGTNNLSTVTKKAVAGIFSYLKHTQKQTDHILKISKYNLNDGLYLNDTTCKHLELTETLIGGEYKGSLLWCIDRTKTSTGARKIRELILNPLININLINERLNAVDYLFNEKNKRNKLSETLSKIRDLERILSKCVAGIATPKEVRLLGDSLSLIPEIKNILSNCDGLLFECLTKIQDSNFLAQKITNTLVSNPPVSPRDGGLIAEKINKELDTLRNMAIEGKNYLARLEKEEKEKTGIPVKIRYNRVFGYYIEITKSYLGKVPSYYIRKQTLANAERFYTQELKEYEEKVLTADEKAKEIEFNEFISLRNEVVKNSEYILNTANSIAMIDCMTSFAEVAEENNFKKPNVDDSLEIKIEEGRHAVVEKILREERFVPNDILLNDDDKRLIIITGPNMAGKSTVMRQTALIVILAQAGSFVPAKNAKIGIVDKIFTRVGAADALIKGQSTFMVEMSEASIILKEATHRSLIIIDEIGRGTSTFDGLSIAWAVAEDIAKRIKARTLFATHYHELTDLGGTNGIVNMNIAVREWQGKVIFLRKLVDGPTSHSYGIQVGEMAGLPKNVVDRAKEVLKQLEELNELEINKLVLKGEKPQIDLFTTKEFPTAVIEKIKSTDLTIITPIEAMNILNDLKKSLE